MYKWTSPIAGHSSVWWINAKSTQGQSGLPTLQSTLWINTSKFVIQPCIQLFLLSKEDSQWQPPLHLKTYQPIRDRKCTCYKVFKDLQSVLLFLFIGQPQISHILPKISYSFTLWHIKKKKKQLYDIRLNKGIYRTLSHWHHLTPNRTEFCKHLYEITKKQLEMLEIKITTFPLNSLFRKKAEVFKIANIKKELK